MIFIYNRDEVQVDILDIDPIITEEIGKLRSLEFESEKEFEKGYRVVAKTEDGLFEFVIIDSEYQRDNKKIHTYFCQDSLIELQSIPILDKRPWGNIEVALKSILDSTRWVLEVRNGYNLTTVLRSSFYHVSALEAFSEIVEKYRSEWITEYKSVGNKITERRLVIYQRDGRSNGRLEFGKNIINFKRTILSEPIVTAIYPYGKGEDLGDGNYGRRISIEDVNNGIPYIENKQATEIYGLGSSGNKKPLFAFLVLEDVEDKNELKKLAQEELDIVSGIRAEHTVDAADINIEVKIGYEVPVIDEEIGYRAYARIIKIVRQGKDVQLTFGTVTKKFVDSFQKSISRTNKAINDVYIQINNVRASADGKTTIFTGPTEPTISNEGDLWYRENADGTVDMLLFKNGIWVEELSEGVFKELRADIEANNQLVNDAKLAADKAVAETEQIKANIEDLGDLSTALSQLDDAQTRIADLEVQISEALGNITADFYGNAPIPPYELHQKWYKTEYTPIADKDTGYESIKDTDNVTLDEFANPGLFICINPKAEGQVFDWNDWKRIATDNTDLINYSIDNLRSEVDKQTINSLNSIKLINDDLVKANEKLSLYYDELLKKADSSEFKILTDTVTEQGLTIGNIEDNQGILIGSVNDIKNTADKSEQTLINLIGTNPDGTYKVAEYNQKISTAQGDIQKIYKDLDPTNTLGTAYKLNETKKSVDSISTSLINYAKKTDLNGLATESYVTTTVTTEAGKIRSEFEDVARITDLTGLVSETKMTSAIETSASQIKTELGKYATKTDLNGLATETYVTNETTKTANAINETLKSYAKTTQLTGLATESFVTNETTKTANAIKTTLLDYAKTTDLNGLATETYALTTAKTEAGRVSQTLTDYKKTNDTKVENINGRVETTEGNYTTLTQKVDGEVQKLFDVTQTVEGQTTVIKDLKGETGNMSLVEIRQNINEFSSKFVNMPDNITGTVKLDSVGVPIAPYKKGNVWYKDDYNFTQGYDKISTTDNVTLDEFANKGVWVAIKDSANGVFNWNDWQRVSADSSFQLSEIYQDIEKIALTVQNNDNNTKSQLLQLSNMIDMTVTKDDLIGQINTQAGNVLIRASADGKSSLLNVTSRGTYIETGIIKNAHIDDGAITRVKIGEAAIDTAKIADAAITSAKILNLDVNKVSGLTSEFVQSKWNAINSSVTITGTGMMIDGDWGGAINFTRRGQTFYDKIKGQVMGYQYGLYRNADDPLLNSQMKGIYLAAEMGYDLTLGIRKQIDNQNNAYMTIKSAGGTTTAADIWGETRLYKGVRTNNQIFYATNDSGSGIKIGAGQALDNWVTTITNAEGTAGIGFTAGGGVMIRRYDSAAGISVWKWL